MAEIDDINKELGNTPQGVYADVRTRLDILEARINNPFTPAPNADNPFFIGGTGVTIHTNFGDPNVLFAIPPPSVGSLYLRQDGYVTEGAYSFREDGYWHPLGGSGGGNFGPGGGLTPTGVLGYVFVRPIDGVQDDWANLSYILQQSAYRNAVVLLPGPNGEAFQAKSLMTIPNGTLLYGTVSTRIVSSLAGLTSSTGPTAPLATTNIVYGTSIHLTQNIAVGNTTFKTDTTGLAIGNTVSLLKNDGYSGGLYTITQITGPSVGVYTITVERPIYWNINHTSDTATLVTSFAKDISIFGNGMSISGTGAWLLSSPGGQNLHFSDLFFDTTNGEPIDTTYGGFGGVYNIGPQTYHCSLTGLYATGFSTNKGAFILGTENLLVKACQFVHCQFGGNYAAFHNFSCVNYHYDDCNTNTIGLYGFITDGYSINADWNNCTTIGNENGFIVNSIVGLQLNGCRSEYNFNQGFAFNSGASNVQVNQCASNYNVTYGFNNNSATNVLINNSAAQNNAYGIFGGGNGFSVNNVDVSYNQQGIGLNSSCQIDGLISSGSIGSPTQYCLNLLAPSINVGLTNFSITSSVLASGLVFVNTGCNLTAKSGQFTLNDDGISVFNALSSCTISVDDITFAGSNVSDGNAFNIQGGTVYVGPNFDVSSLSSATWSATTALFVFSGSNGLTYNVRTISSTYTVDSSNLHDNVIFTSGTPFNITLPAPAAGRVLTIKDAGGHASTNIKTILPHASETIDGYTSFLLQADYDSVILVSDGVNWFTTNIIILPPRGPAGGDLSGNFPNPTVVKIQTFPVNPATPSDGQALIWSASHNNWAPTTIPPSPPGGPAGGDLTGTYPNPVVVGLDTTPLSINLPQPSQVITWDGYKWTNSPAPPPSGNAGGDLFGTYPNPHIGSLQTFPLNITFPAANQILLYTGAEWANAALPPPSGPAGGDLGGSYPNPIVTGLQHFPVASSTPVATYVLTWTGSVWSPQPPPPPSGAAGGDLAGSYPNPRVAQLQGRTVSAASPSNLQVLTWSSAGSGEWAPANAPPPSGPAGGDLSGSYPNPDVIKIQGQPLSGAAPATGQVLTWGGAQWAPANQQPPTGSAGGDLSGIYPNPVVSKIQTFPINPAQPTNGQVLGWVGGTSGIWEAINPPAPTGSAGGDLGSTYPNPTVVGLQSRPILAGAPSTGQVLTWIGTAWSPSSLPGPSGTASGDLSGGYPGPTVAKIQGTPVSATAPTTNQVLAYNGTNWIPTTSNLGASFVYVQPINGTSDDWANLQTVLNNNAYKNAVVLLPGNSGQAFQAKSGITIPSGTILIGTPGTKIVNSTTGLGGVPFYFGMPTLGTTITLTTGPNPGSNTFTTTTTGITAGNFVYFNDEGVGGSSLIAIQYTVLSVTGSGTFTVTLDRPVDALGGSLLRANLVTTRTQDVYIYGNGMTITGVGEAYIYGGGCYNCHVENVRFDTSGGQPASSLDGSPNNIAIVSSGGLVGFVWGSLNCSIRDIYATGFTCSLGCVVSGENIVLDRLVFNNCAFGGGTSNIRFAPIYIASAYDVRVSHCDIKNDGYYGLVVDAFNSVPSGASSFVYLNDCFTSKPVSSNYVFNINFCNHLTMIGCVVNEADASRTAFGLLLTNILVAEISNCHFIGLNTGINIGVVATKVFICNCSTTFCTNGIINSASPATLNNIDITSCNIGITCNASTLINNLVSTTAVSSGIGISVLGGNSHNFNNLNLVCSATNYNGLFLNNASSNVNVSNSFFNVNTSSAMALASLSFEALGINNCYFTGVGFAMDLTSSGSPVYIGFNVDVSNITVGNAYVGNVNYIFSGTNGSSRITTTISGAFTIDSTSGSNKRDDVILATGTTSYTITLPAAQKNRQVIIKDADGSATAHPKTISPPSGTIDGSASATLNSNFEPIRLISDGTNWFTI